MVPADFLLRALLAWAPFHVLFTVFFTYRLGVPGMGAVKDGLLAGLVAAVAWAYLRARRMPRWGWDDALVAAYAVWMVAASALEGDWSWRAAAVGARFDLQFFVAFLAAKHAVPFLAKPLGWYLKWFLAWGGAALGLGILVRFVTHEDVLVRLGWSGNLSTWTPGGAPPIWHGVPGANVRRFQGIFDGPNQMATFLLGFAAAWAAWTLPSPARREGGIAVLAVLMGLLALTYTRSAMLSAAAVLAVGLLAYLPRVWRKHRSALVAGMALLALAGGLFWLRYNDRLGETFKRAGSTKAHFERMETGLTRFWDSPWTGHGLAASGPAARLSGRPLPDSEALYIPESWYVQQLVEGGVPALALFCLAALAVLVLTWRRAPLLALGLLALYGMNLLLHAFESAWAVVPFLALCGLFAARGRAVPDNKNA